MKSVWTFNCPNEVTPIAEEWLKTNGFTLIEGMVAKTPQFVKTEWQQLPKFNVWIQWYESVMTSSEMDNLDPFYFDTPFQCVITEEGDTTEAFSCFPLGKDQELMLAAR